MSFRKKSMLKVIVLGDSGVGKTSVLNRYIKGSFDGKFKATIGADFLTKELQLDDNSMVSMQVWDTAGQERFATLGVAFYRGADAVILVYDISNKTSFDNIQKWKQDFLESGNIQKENEFPFVIFGNKCDLPINKRKVHSTDVKSKYPNAPFVETSAKNSNNIEQGFKIVADLAVKYNKKIDGDQGFKFNEIKFDDDFNKRRNNGNNKEKCNCQLL